jgi:hypothetical protein
MSVFYNAHQLSPEPIFISEFNAYSTLSGFPRNGEALCVLRTLASIVEPFMKRHGIRIDLLKEFFSDEHTLGLNTAIPSDLDDTHKTDTIHIPLHSHDDPTAFLSAQDLLQTMCHKLAHCRYREHDENFLREWQSIMEEVEEDLGGFIVFRHVNNTDPYKKRVDKLAEDSGLRLVARLRACAGRRGVGCPKVIHVAQIWQAWYNEMEGLAQGGHQLHMY